MVQYLEEISGDRKFYQARRFSIADHDRVRRAYGKIAAGVVLRVHAENVENNEAVPHIV